MEEEYNNKVEEEKQNLKTTMEEEYNNKVETEKQNFKNKLKTKEKEFKDKLKTKEKELNEAKEEEFNTKLTTMEEEYNNQKLKDKKGSNGITMGIVFVIGLLVGASAGLIWHFSTKEVVEAEDEVDEEKKCQHVIKENDAVINVEDLKNQNAVEANQPEAAN